MSNKFNIGDKVRLVKEYDGLPVGAPGVVVSYNKEGMFHTWPFYVKFDGQTGDLGWLVALDEIELLQPEVKLGDRVEFVKSRPGLGNFNGYKGVITGEDAYSLHVTLDGDTFYRMAWKDELKVLPVEVKKAPAGLSSAKARLYPSAKIILKHLNARQTISPMEALASYGCMRLAARIHDLREAGVKIATEMHKDHAGHPYARYSLVA